MKKLVALFAALAAFAFVPSSAQARNHLLMASHSKHSTKLISHHHKHHHGKHRKHHHTVA